MKPFRGHIMGRESAGFIGRPKDFAPNGQLVLHSPMSEFCVEPLPGLCEFAAEERGRLGKIDPPGGLVGTIQRLMLAGV